jgi:RNA polymerase sigma-70 factor (ECF subfamily)
MRPPPPSLVDVANRYGGWIRGKLRSRFPAEADDLEQDAMLRIAQALPRMQATEERSLRALISRVLRSVMVDEVRRKKRLPVVEEAAGEVAATTAAPGDAVAGAEDAAKAKARFGYLTEEQRRILTLRFQHGLAFRQIAEILGVPQGTVAGWYSRALGVLRESL